MSKWKLFVLAALATLAAAFGAGWKWHHAPGHGAMGVERIAGWTWDGSASADQ